MGARLFHLLLKLGVVALPACEVGGKAAAVSIIGKLGRVLLCLTTTREREANL
jgi:hypothetical protein